ncbi:hypothetical protein EYF80_006385 [Liparis tanakae]|uniref:Uncharacterized protein n=1 Tax=Liparis tanakae TaxID=230148 RepID=A0A4Z2J0R2_9TELE|nr:hypothetical protein EYF80_006385 [Liparis tanakae]
MSDSAFRCAPPIRGHFWSREDKTATVKNAELKAAKLKGKSADRWVTSWRPQTVGAGLCPIGFAGMQTRVSERLSDACILLFDVKHADFTPRCLESLDVIPQISEPRGDSSSLHSSPTQTLLCCLSPRAAPPHAGQSAAAADIVKLD